MSNDDVVDLLETWGAAVCSNAIPSNTDWGVITKVAAEVLIIDYVEKLD